MPHFRKLIGDHCYLAPTSTEDASLWAKWDADLEVAIPMGDEAHRVITVEKERETLAMIAEKRLPEFMIVLNDGDVPIGRCMLMEVDLVNRTAVLGMTIGEKEHWNRGYGLEATHLLLEYAFHLLNLHSVMLGVYSFNRRAIRCYQKAGFKEIGRRREARMFGPKAYDMVLMDMLATEFPSRQVARLIEQ